MRFPKIKPSAVLLTAALLAACLEELYDATSVPDYEKISDAYKGDVLRAYNTGITEGMDSAHTFSPKTFLTRAQVCQLLMNVGVGA